MRFLFVLGSMGSLAMLAAACGDSGGSDLGHGGRGTAAAAGDASGGASGKGGASTGGSSTGGKSGEGGTATGGRSSGGSAGSGPTGGDGTTGGNAGAAGSPGGGSPSGGEGGAGVVGSPPTATINHPGDGEMRTVNSSIPFVGVGTDPEDGTLTGGSLVWTSNREGAIGTGQTFNAPLTQTGMQVITLTVTDSDGNQATDSITLDIR